MTEAFDSPTILNIKYAIGFVGTLACSLLIVKVLFNIELHQFKRSLAPDVEKNLSELTLSSSHSEDDEAGFSRNKSVIKQSLSRGDDLNCDSYTRKKILHKETKMGIFFNVGLLTFLNYLLLVYLPGGAVSSLIGMTLLSFILLRSQLLEDVRRKRLDRISLILTLMIFTASCLSLCTYARIGKKEGGVYEGPARIVGYDVTNYNNENQSALRTDLEVEWGGSWGCPDTPNRKCRAYVSGALCEVKEDRKLDESQSYYKQVMEYQKEFVQEEKNAVEETAKEYDLEYVEVLQETQDILQDESNATENEIESIEMNITVTTQDIAEDFEGTIKDGDDENSSSETKGKAEKDILALEKEIAALEKKVQELEEQDIEEQEMGEITEGAAEYYAEVAQEAVNATQDLEEENVQLNKDVEYYSKVVDEVEEKNEELKEENQVLAEENEVLEEEVVDNMDYYQMKEGTEATTEEMDDSNKASPTDNFESFMDDNMFTYTFEDDFFEDEYWAYDWNSAWGDYACNDLFDTDLEGLSYEEDLPPGNDEWPYVNIFGSCNSCKAYLVDYYSTEHFERIKQYEKHSLTYMSYGIVGVFITGFFMFKQWLKPAEEYQVDLLVNDGRGFV
jgi:hypothetical protein